MVTIVAGKYDCFFFFSNSHIPTVEGPKATKGIRCKKFERVDPITLPSFLPDRSALSWVRGSGERNFELDERLKFSFILDWIF